MIHLHQRPWKTDTGEEMWYIGDTETWPEATEKRGENVQRPHGLGIEFKWPSIFPQNYSKAH